MAETEIQHLFVCGAPKSGTTWLQNILNFHPEVACSGEGHFVEMLANPLAGVVKGYNAKMKLVSERVYQGRPSYAPIDQALFDEVTRDLIVRLMRRQAGDRQVRWLGDKTPRYCEFLPSLNRLFPRSRIFHIVRDPRDVIVSRLHHAKRAGVIESVEAAPEAARAQLIDNAVGAWIKNVRSVQAMAPRLGERLLTVRYEALLADPEAGVREVFAHLGYELSPERLADIVARSDFEAMSGGVKRGANDPTNFFRSGTSGEHAHVLTDAERARVDERILPLMGELGMA